MENKNNGRGIFYGVIGVATLVVAIIGATFAYFTASVSTNNNAINVAATRVNLVISAEESNLKNNLIPVDTVKANGDPVTAFYRYPGLAKSGQGEKTCVDNAGNSICSVYQVTVQNPVGSATQNVTGSLTVVANTGFTNLKYAVFSGDADTVWGKTNKFDANAAPRQASQAGTGLLVHAGAIDNVNTVDEWESGDEGAEVNYSKVTLTSGQTATFTIVVWLEDTGAAQNDEQGKVFAAAVNFKSAEGSEVTGLITAA